MPERRWAQVDLALAAHQAQLQQKKAQNDAIHIQVKTQEEIELAKIKAALVVLDDDAGDTSAGGVCIGKVQRPSYRG